MLDRTEVQPYKINRSFGTFSGEPLARDILLGGVLIHSISRLRGVEVTFAEHFAEILPKLRGRSA